MSTVKTDLSASTSALSRLGFSNIIKHKIGKLHNARKRLSSRSKSSPALMVIDSKIQPPLNTTTPKRQKSIVDEIPTCQTIIDLS